MRWQRWLGVSMGVVALALFVVVGSQDVGSDYALVDILGILAFASPALVGGFLVWRLPANPVGWILATFGLTFTLGVMGESLAAIDHPLTAWGVWLGTWQWALSMGLILVLLPLRFPDGRLPSPRYRWVTPVMVIGLCLLILGNAFRATADVSIAGGSVLVDLPLRLPWSTDVFDLIALLGLAVMLAAVGGAVTSAVMRFRRSTGIERQQMKVFAGALSISIVGMALNLILYELGNEPVANALFAIWVLVLVSSIAIAVLRYRLYDFDRVVSRTVSYALLVLILGAVYGAGAVWLPTRIVGEQSPLFVAGSTLAVAALFTPVRRRVMTWVDSRFYRSRYQLERVMDDFSSHLQDQVDPDRMASDWVDLVSDTLRPTTVGVWLRRA
ncbi:MAG: hypothetical protein ACRDXF_03285 [Acidimicrobiia bacterium]